MMFRDETRSVSKTLIVVVAFQGRSGWPKEGA
jgi:hypothetical protein